MRLFRTGAFIRAARTVPAPQRVYKRWSSTQPVKAYPNQSTNLTSETDPRKTSDASANEKSKEEADFQKKLQDGLEGNKIVTTASGLTGARILNQAVVFDHTSNLSPSILDLVGRNLYDTPNHPLCITRRLIESVFAYPTYKNHIATNPVVTTHDNFDILGFPADHPGRSRTDTYYVDSTRVLRTHTSAHQHAAFEYMANNPEMGYTICADVYRRDSIDRSHFPVFHQMEGARMWDLPEKENPKETKYDQLWHRIRRIREDIASLPQHDLEIIDQAGPHHQDTNPVQVCHDVDEVEAMGDHLKRSLETLVAKVFTAARAAGVGGGSNEPLKVRWIEAYFPFTSPSWELEVWWQGEWLELLGCGITQQNIINRAGLKDHIGWAWGIGIERLAMLLFGIPDIRLFWSQDQRFLNQFKEGTITNYQAFSKYPPCLKSISFWLPKTSPTSATLADSPTATSSSSTTGIAAAAGGDATKSSPLATHPAAFHENDFMEIVRDVAGSLAEDVKLVDEFVHPRSGRKSLCYDINYRSLERTLTNDEVNELHRKVEAQVLERVPGSELR